MKPDKERRKEVTRRLRKWAAEGNTLAVSHLALQAYRSGVVTTASYRRLYRVALTKAMANKRLK